MDKPIGPGDLVTVMRSHCPASAADELGLYLTVMDVTTLDEGSKLLCRQCQQTFGSGERIAEVEPFGWHPTRWLKRIPPLSELETERTEETLKEPA